MNQHDKQPQCPFPGYRFLVQLVDAATLEDAKRELSAIFGEQAASVARFTKGTIRPVPVKQPYTGWRWQQTDSGFRCYIPREFRV